jgi:hypothetical protein
VLQMMALAMIARCALAPSSSAQVRAAEAALGP